MGRVTPAESPSRGKNHSTILPDHRVHHVKTASHIRTNSSTSTGHDTWAFEPTSTYDRQLLEKELERRYIRQSLHPVEKGGPHAPGVERSGVGEKKFDLSDPLVLIRQGVESILQDDFTCCFESRRQSHWNWNLYLFPMWVAGVLVRYCILFPLRLIGLLLFAFVFSIGFSLSFLDRNTNRRHGVQRRLIQFLCGAFVVSWSGVIKFHGVIPKPGPNQVFVANHSSMIDMIILGWGMQAFAVVGQQHGGWVGFCQNYILSCLGCIWFNRSESRDRKKVTARIQGHVRDAESNPLLLFPEGTCVNNEYCIMFKKGAFELDAVVYPVAIKYNKTFVDAYWNSRADSFQTHLFRLMTSWCVVCDVWFLDPQVQQEGESTVEFAERVKMLICKKAKLTPVPWDGYLKYFRLGPRFVQEKQKLFAQMLQRQSFFSPSTTAATLAAHHPGETLVDPPNSTTADADVPQSDSVSIGRAPSKHRGPKHSVAVMVSRSEIQDHLLQSERARAEGNARRRKARKAKENAPDDGNVHSGDGAAGVGKGDASGTVDNTAVVSLCD